MKAIRKNAREEYRVTRAEFKGYDLINIRVWFQDRETGTMRTGRDGITVRAGAAKARSRG
jgi:hypothetical protein